MNKQSKIGRGHQANYSSIYCSTPAVIFLIFWILKDVKSSAVLPLIIALVWSELKSFRLNFTIISSVLHFLNSQKSWDPCISPLTFRALIGANKKSLSQLKDKIFLRTNLRLGAHWLALVCNRFLFSCKKWQKNCLKVEQTLCVEYLRGTHNWGPLRGIKLIINYKIRKKSKSFLSFTCWFSILLVFLLIDFLFYSPII